MLETYGLRAFDIRPKGGSLGQENMQRKYEYMKGGGGGCANS